MGTQFFHDFKDGLGPWQHRHTLRAIQTGEDCTKLRYGNAILGVKQDPLRTGHIWVPPEVFTVTEGFVEFRMRFGGPPGAHGAGWLQDLQPYRNEDAHEIDVVEDFGNHSVAHHAIWTQIDDDPQPEKVLAGKWRVDMTQWNVFGCAMNEFGYTFTVNDREITSSSNLYTSVRPKVLILSVLISDWELLRYGFGNGYNQKARCDWVKVSDL